MLTRHCEQLQLNRDQHKLGLDVWGEHRRTIFVLEFGDSATNGDGADVVGRNTLLCPF